MSVSFNFEAGTIDAAMIVNPRDICEFDDNFGNQFILLYIIIIIPITYPFMYEFTFCDKSIGG